METITLKVRTQAQAELLLTKIKELETQELMITAKYTPTKAKKKVERKEVAPQKKNKRLKAIEEGLKDVKAIEEGKTKPKTIQQFLKEVKQNG